MLRVLLLLSRVILGIVFILSGFLKGVDPLGSAYKFGDYFMAFGLDAMDPLALFLSFSLSSAELLIGLLLLFNVLPRINSWAVFLFMAFFTPLTLYIAIYNPVADCGCFGDAFIITNWETFFKNIPLLAASILLLLNRNRIEPTLSPKWDYYAAVFLAALSLAPPVHGYRNLPLMDFRPYSVGSSIPDNMSTPPGAPVDVYKTLLFYQKDGVVQEFTQDDFPWQDTTWKFVDSKSILLEKGYEPPITSFVLTDMNGYDVTDEVTHSFGYYLLAVSYRVDRINTKSIDRLNQIYFQSQDQGIGFAMVTASTRDAIDKLVSQTGAAFPFLQADEIMLKTTIRANPGLILLYDGTVIGKWHYRNFPEAQYFKGNLLSKQISSQRGSKQRAWALILSLGILALLGAQRLIKAYSK